MKTLKRRRKEFKTDYAKRMKYLKSRKPRIVFRKTNRYIIAQYVESREAQDKVILGVNSKDLVKYGWDEKAQSSLKSLTACYLTGYLIGKQIKAKKLRDPIVDFGMKRTLHKSNVFGFIKGLVDSGIKIECDKSCFPDEARIKGGHLKNKVDFEKIRENIK